MGDEIDVESFGIGILWGIVIVILLIRFETWLRRPPKPQPIDPFDALKWDVLNEARTITGEVITDAT